MRNVMIIPAAFALTLVCACGKQPVQEPAASEVPSAVPEAAEPEAGSPDFSLLSGTWHTENNRREITVYDNGGFAPVHPLSFVSCPFPGFALNHK